MSPTATMKKPKKGKKVRVQKSRQIEIDQSIKSLKSIGFEVQNKDHAILKIAPRGLVTPINMDLYSTLTAFEKTDYQKGCRNIVNGKAKIDLEKVLKNLELKEQERLKKLSVFIERRRDDQKSDSPVKGKEIKRKSSASDEPAGKRPRIELTDVRLSLPIVVSDVLDRSKAAENIKSVVTGLKSSYSFFLEKCKLQIGDEKDALIKRRCDDEGFLIDINGKLCTLHISQLFSKLDDFVQPMNNFREGQCITVFIRDVVEFEKCSFLTRTKGLAGNLIVSTTLIPPDEWLLKVPNQFTVYKCQPDVSYDDKLSVCIGPHLKGFIPFQFWDEELIIKAKDMQNGTAINVFSFRLDRNLSKFVDFIGSRIKKDDCFKISKGMIVPIVRINVTNYLLPCKSRFTGWKLLLPLTEADDNFDETNRRANLVPTLGIIMAINEKKKTAIVSTRLSRLQHTPKDTAFKNLLPKEPSIIQDKGIMNARLLYNKQGSELRGFVVKRADSSQLDVFMGMDYLCPIFGRVSDDTGAVAKRLNHLSLVKVVLQEDTFETKTGVKVLLHNQEKVVEADGAVSDVPDELPAEMEDFENENEDGFDWDYDGQPNLSHLATEMAAAEESDDSDNSEKPAAVERRKTKQERDEERRQREALMRETERKLAKGDDHQQLARTTADFDRDVMINPNDSKLWISYMAHHAQQLEIDRARQVVKRGLKTILGDEQEKLNLWQALLNLENMYGTQETVEATFREALKHNDDFKIYSHLAKLYGSSGKIDDARRTYHTMLKKFRERKELWIDYATWLFDVGQLQEARDLLKKSFNSLENKDHIAMICKVAQLEFSKGETDAGKSLMENLLLTYPKRLDLFNVYVDQLIKIKDIGAVRNCFLKTLQSKLSLKKMKSVFKKWIDFEQKHGTPNSVEEVKAKVVEYIEGETSQ